MQLNTYVPDPNQPSDPSQRPSFLRRTSKAFRELASGVVSKTAPPEKVKRYKELLFSAARQLDEADRLIPEEQLIIPNGNPPWWAYALLGAISVVIPFLVWIAYMRFIAGVRIGFITE